MPDNFSFRGEHISSYGAQAYLGEGFAVGGKISRREYAMAYGGTILIGAERGGSASVSPTTRQLVIWPSDGVSETPAWRRALLTWLQGGRGELIYDNDPGVYRIAQFDAEGTAGAQIGPMGGVKIAVTMQGVCVSLAEDTATARGRGRTTLALSGATGLPAPLRVRVRATSAPVTLQRIEAGGAAVIFRPLLLAAGDTLDYYAGDEHGGALDIRKNGQTDFSGVDTLARLTSGERDVNVVIQTSGGEASIEVGRRGRWID